MKIFKLFVCSLLILSVSLINSIAAISVSDGSAFVTKAEFAADLNNLSNRMSSLENSLDAKIDSLVSSYLSRNGIWNGEKQTFNLNFNQSISFGLSTDQSQRVIAKDDNGYTYAYVVGESSMLVDGNSKGQNGTKWISGSAQKYSIGILHKFIKTSKAGLLNFSVTFVGSDKSYNEIGITVSEWDRNSNYNGLTGVAGLVISKGDEYNFNNENSRWVSSSLYGYSSSKNFYTGISESDTKYMLHRVYIPFPFGRLTLLGFVNKGDELNLGFIVSGYSAYYATKTWKANSEGGFKLTDLDAYIY